MNFTMSDHYKSHGSAFSYIYHTFMGMPSNNSYILAAGWYHSLASTFEYLNHFYQKKSEKCCLLCTLYCLEISVPSKEQNTILKVARQQFFIIHGEFSPTS